jgi:hypothetical protein
MIDGQIVMEQKQVRTVDKSRVLPAADQALRRLLERL